MKEIEYEKIVRYEKDLKDIIEGLVFFYLIFIIGIGIGCFTPKNELLLILSVPTAAVLIVLSLVVFLSRKVTWRKVK